MPLAEHGCPYVTSGISSSTGRSKHSAATSRVLTVKVGANAITIDPQYNLLSYWRDVS
jgi:hypothetical protein